jgi:hypothetical protein
LLSHMMVQVLCPVILMAILTVIQSKIKDYYPCAIYTHCMAHRLNLVVVDICKNIKVIYLLLIFINIINFKLHTLSLF